MVSPAFRSRLLFVTTLLTVGVCACATLHPEHRHADVTPSAGASVAATAQSEALLTVTITDLRNHNGDLIFGVFTQPDGFPNIQAKSVHWEVKPAEAAGDGGTVTFAASLPPGRYAAGVLHDENRDGDMNKGLAGIPLEGYGVTNNPKPHLRKATFEEATFTLPPEGATMTISLQYFSK